MANDDYRTRPEESVAAVAAAAAVTFQYLQNISSGAHTHTRERVQ